MTNSTIEHMLLRNDTGGELPSVKVVGVSAYAYINFGPCFHRGSHDQILKENGIDPKSVTWKFDQQEMAEAMGAK